MEETLITIRDYADNAHGTQMRKYTPERYIVSLPVSLLRSLILLVCSFFLTGCDPIDDRLHLQNDSKDTIIARVFLLHNAKMVSAYGDAPISSKENKILGRISNWDNEFESIESDSLMRVIVFRNTAIASDPLNSFNHHISDSIVATGAYEFRDYSYNYLKEHGWQVKYPTDGFFKGLPEKIVYSVTEAQQ